MKKKILIIIVAVILLFNLIIIGIIFKNKKTNTENNIEKIEVKENNEDLEKLQEAVEYAVLRYQETIYNDLTNDDWKAYSLNFITSLMEAKYKIVDDNSCSSLYQDYESEDYTLCYYYGLSEEEIKNVENKSLYIRNEAYIRPYPYYEIDLVKELYKQYYGTYCNIFDNSFQYYLSFKPYYNATAASFVYDKNINVLFKVPLNGSTVYIERKITNRTTEGNLLKIEYIEYYTNDGSIYKDSDYQIKIFDNDDPSKIEAKLIENVDKFEKYTAIFEKTNGAYRYKKTI